VPDEYHRHFPEPGQLPRSAHVHAHRDSPKGHTHPGLYPAIPPAPVFPISQELLDDRAEIDPNGKMPDERVGIHRRRPAETAAAGFAIPAGVLEAALRHNWLAAGLLFAAGVLPAVVSGIKDHGIRGLVQLVWKGGGS
jgi:hypothetical protein